VKIKLDENVPADLQAIFRGGHEADTVQSEGLLGKDDETTWAAAQVEGRFLITQDLDFSDLRKFMPGTHCGILLLRLRNPSRSALAKRLLEISENEEFESWWRCFVVATDLKIRVRRPTKD
jgi:predicted nuclease of predicted toxin-antitoxin system